MEVHIMALDFYFWLTYDYVYSYYLIHGSIASWFSISWFLCIGIFITRAKIIYENQNRIFTL